MKIQCISDIHLEFGHYYSPEKLGDVLVLAGDIGVGLMVADYLNECAKEWDDVIFVYGNHEFYNKDMTNVREALPNMVADNVHILDNSCVDIGDVHFLGSTLWSEAATEGWYALNDSVLIGKDGERFSYEQMLQEFADSVQFLKDNIVQGKKNVVVTHHAPDFKMSNWEKYGLSKITTAFATDKLLQQFDPKDIYVWFSGHTHAAIQMNIDGIYNVSNCKGYPGESLKGEIHEFDPNLIVEI